MPQQHLLLDYFSYFFALRPSVLLLIRSHCRLLVRQYRAGEPGEWNFAVITFYDPTRWCSCQRASVRGRARVGQRWGESWLLKYNFRVCVREGVREREREADGVKHQSEWNSGRHQGSWAPKWLTRSHLRLPLSPLSSLCLSVTTSSAVEN